MVLKNHVISQASVALFVILSILPICSLASGEQNSSEKILSIPSHLSWTSDGTRFDLVFNTEAHIENIIKLNTDTNNFLTGSLSKCANSSACLFKNGTYLESFHVNNSITHETIFESTFSKKEHVVLDTNCDSGNRFKLVHYCSTHWNPPVYLTKFNCYHIIEWHSPLRCHPGSINHEHPCYIYGPEGKLVDLTPWILSNGSSYKVDTDSSQFKDLHINVCNEAHDPCGPGVSACYRDEQHNLIESGYNNLTSIKYDATDKTVILTSLGQFKQQCEGSRIKTVIRFMCKDKISMSPGPKLTRSGACESVIEWPTVSACPMSEVKLPATECKLKHAPLGINLDIKKLTNNQTTIKISDIILDGKKKKMLLGICQGLPRSLSCEGKSTSTTKACLMDATDIETVGTANNSQIVGSVTKSHIRLVDDRVYLESYAPNKTCSENVREGFLITQQVGTRIEFYCSPQTQESPTFLGYDSCIYVFEWGSPLICLESLIAPTPNKSSSTDMPANRGNITDHVGEDKGKKVPAFEVAEESVMKDTIKKPSRMDSTHKFLMIGLIVSSFAAFIVIIFVLDKKTRLRITLRQARQAFQSNQQPYSRVVNDLDL